MPKKRLPTHHHTVTAILLEVQATIKNENDFPSSGIERRLDRQNWLRLKALEEQATWYTAGSPEAALFHLGLIDSTADDLANMLTLTNREEEAGDLYHRIDRLVSSLMAYVEATSGVRREDFGLDWYHSRDLEPKSFGRAA